MAVYAFWLTPVCVVSFCRTTSGTPTSEERCSKLPPRCLTVDPQVLRAFGMRLSGIVWKYYLVEEATKLIEKNNSAAVTSEASAVGGNDKVVSTDPSRSASDRSNLRATRATGLSFIDQDLMEPERQPAWKPSAATTYTIAATPVADSALSSTTPVIPIGKAVDSLKVYRGYPNETDAAHRTNSFGAKNSNLLSPPLLLSSEAAAKLASGGYLVSDSPRAHQSQPRGTRDWTANPGVFQSSDVDRPYSRRPAASTIKATPSSGDHTSAYYGTVSRTSPPITSSAVLTNDVNAPAPVIPRPSSRFFHQNDTSCTTSQTQHSRSDVHAPSSNNTVECDMENKSCLQPGSSGHIIDYSGNNNNKIATIGCQASLPSSSIPYAHSQVSIDVSRSTVRDRFALLSQTTDYRRLYEREKVEEERLARELDRINRENTNLRLQLSRLKADDGTHTPENIAPILNDKPSIVDKLHNRLLYHEGQLEELSRLREENAKMKEENGALIRVISKLSKPT